MTTDALLAIALGVAIPFLLAVAGGILAVRALPAETARSGERSIWITIFIGLFLVGVGLAFIQQIRMTNLQAAADQKENQKDIQHAGEVRYTQGQLDSINKVLAALVQAGGNSNDQEVLKALFQATQKMGTSPNVPNGKDFFDREMSNADLREEVKEVTDRLGQKAGAWEQVEREIPSKERQAQRAALLQGFATDSETIALLRKANFLDDLVSERLGEKVQPEKAFKMVGPIPINAECYRLRQKVMKLPL